MFGSLLLMIGQSSQSINIFSLHCCHLDGNLVAPCRKVSVQEQILNTALGESRKNIRQLSALAKEVESSLEREKKQFERLHFALKKAHADAAYLKSMERRLARKEEGLPE